VAFHQQDKMVQSLCFLSAGITSCDNSNCSGLAFALSNLSVLFSKFGRTGYIGPCEGWNKAVLQLACRAGDLGAALNPTLYDALFSSGYSLVQLGREHDAAANRLMLANSLLRRSTAVRSTLLNGTEQLIQWSTGRVFAEGNLKASTAFKLAHDAAQLGHLIAKGALPQSHVLSADAYTWVSKRWAEEDEDSSNTDSGHLRPFRALDASLVKLSYNQLVYIRPTPSINENDVLRADLDWTKLENDYMTSHPSVLVVDDFLSETALASLGQWAEDSTFWWDVRSRGYLGADLGTGFANGLLIQVAAKLREKCPRVFHSHPLVQASPSVHVW